MAGNSISIKNMVCPRCVSAVKAELEKLNIKYTSVNLGEAILDNPLTESAKYNLSQNLNKLGFELLNDKNARTIEKIKNTIIEFIHYSNKLESELKLSDHLKNSLGQNYSTLSKLFSDVEGITIEKYMIIQKIEKAKEFLIYDEMNISEIAYHLNYSTSQHFSTQFKNVTGLSPSQFKKGRPNLRKSLDEL